MMHSWKRPYLFPLFALAGALAFGAVVMLLWNAIVPGLTQWAPLTYSHAIGLLVLCRILFGGFRGGHGGCHGRHMHHGGHWRERWQNMSEEQRAQMRDKWKQRCGPEWSKGPDEGMK